MKKQSQSGFAIVELVMVAVVLAVIVIAGYYVLHNRKTNSSSTSTSSSLVAGYQSPTTTTPPAPQINSASDLNSAMSALNQTSVGSSNTDSSQLTTQTNSF
jgi:cell division protein FtsN